MTAESVTAESIACVVCRKALKSAISDNSDWLTPDGGMSFISYGNYGSTLYDLEGDKFLQVVICDECVVVAARAGLVHQGHPKVTPSTTFTTWTPRPVGGTE